MGNNKRNISIQLIRIIAMFMIILDHLLMGIDIPLKSFVIQVANSGTFIFLFLSGFLYGKKKIDNWMKWYAKRIVRICLPMWLFMIVDFIVEYFMWGNIEIKHIFIYMFNLQGILGVNTTGASLWFLTLIMICYLITPILQWIKNKNPNKMVAILSLIGAIILQIILAYATNIGMVAGHTLSWCIIAVGMYVAGYLAGNIILPHKISVKRISVITVMTIISSAIVLVFNHKFDGQVIYDRIVIFYGMVMIDLWICTILYKLGQHIRDGIWTKIITHLDSISYEFYIVHGLIIAAVIQPLIGKFGVVTYICGTIVLSYVGAWVLHGVCSLVYRKIKVN